MTTEPANKSGARLDREYEDDLRELFERLLKGTRTAEPEGAVASGVEAGPEAEPKTGPKDAAEPEAQVKAMPATEDKVSADAEAPPGSADTEAPADPEDRVNPADREARRTGRLRPRPRRLLVPALAVVVAAAIGAAAFLAGRSAGAGEDEPRRKLAVRVGEIASTLYNYDYRQVDQYLTRQPSVMTKEMAAQVGQSRETISAIITGGKLVWTSRVTRVYVADVNDRSASAIVELNGKVTNTKGISTLTGTVVRFQLANVRGVWLVAKAPETLTVGNESVTDLNGKPVPAPSASVQPGKR